MDDREVGRLRNVRKAALRTRAVAHALAAADDASHSGRLHFRTALSAWRVARMITGRLRGHPFTPFQRDAGSVMRAGQTLLAALAAWRGRGPDRTVLIMEAQVAELRRRVLDARALTRDPELSDAFGRAQAELSALQAALHAQRGTELRRRDEARVFAAPQSAAATEVRGEEWPFIAF